MFLLLFGSFAMSAQSLADVTETTDEITCYSIYFQASPESVEELLYEYRQLYEQELQSKGIKYDAEQWTELHLIDIKLRKEDLAVNQ